MVLHAAHPGVEEIAQRLEFLDALDGHLGGGAARGGLDEDAGETWR